VLGIFSPPPPRHLAGGAPSRRRRTGQLTDSWRTPTSSRGTLMPSHHPAPVRRQHLLSQRLTLAYSENSWGWPCSSHRCTGDPQLHPRRQRRHLCPLRGGATRPICSCGSSGLPGRRRSGLAFMAAPYRVLVVQHSPCSPRTSCRWRSSSSCGSSARWRRPRAVSVRPAPCAPPVGRLASSRPRRGAVDVVVDQRWGHHLAGIASGLWELATHRSTPQDPGALPRRGGAGLVLSCGAIPT